MEPNVIRGRRYLMAGLTTFVATVIAVTLASHRLFPEDTAGLVVWLFIVGLLARLAFRGAVWAQRVLVIVAAVCVFSFLFGFEFYQASGSRDGFTKGALFLGCLGASAGLGGLAHFWLSRDIAAFMAAQRTKRAAIRRERRTRSPGR